MITFATTAPERCWSNGGLPPIRAGGAGTGGGERVAAAQRVLHAHRGGRACAASQPFLLRGLIHCGRCGLLYSGKDRQLQEHCPDVSLGSVPSVFPNRFSSPTPYGATPPKAMRRLPLCAACPPWSAPG
jgi:hypothetical protein